MNGLVQATAVRKTAIRDLDDIELLAKEAREVDNTGTVATEDRFENIRKIQREKEERRQAVAAAEAEANRQSQASAVAGSETASEGTASACPSASVRSETASTITHTQDENENDDDDDDDEDNEGADEVQIDEELFADDLEDVEEQLRETNLTS